MKIKFIILFVLVSLVSCNKTKIYHKFDKNFDLNRWSKKDVKTYVFSVTKEDKYDVVIEFSHIYDYDMDTIPLELKMKSPNGIETTDVINLPIKDKKGKHLADCSGDICDLKYTYKSNLFLSKGLCNISLSNTSKIGFLPNVLGVGLTVFKSK